MDARVLVANDDGVKARGMWFLVDILKDMGFTVYFATTRLPYSGAGKSVSWKFKVETANIRGVTGIIATGTPAAAVLYVLNALDWSPDFVVTGINHGANLGLEDLFTSGTYGAALESVLNGVPAISISKFLENNTRDIEFSDEDRFYLKLIIERFWRIVQDSEALDCLPLNVNLPSTPPKGIAVTRVSRKVYRGLEFVENDGLYEIRRNLSGFYDDGLAECNDIWAVYNSLVSVSPTCPWCLGSGEKARTRDLSGCGVDYIVEGCSNGIRCI
ncbi:MAG: 5'/3'-nucleotidase SurE [Desulfurococcales archaeon]|nr:5'/3'-nucleotidase SurE [Desulfurococcales archaeon]